jgi:hypothetical protein
MVNTHSIGKLHRATCATPLGSDQHSGTLRPSPKNRAQISLVREGLACLCNAFLVGPTPHYYTIDTLCVVPAF